MHPKFARADELSKIVIGAAIEVHRVMGPGLIESIYEKCLTRELKLRGVVVRTQDMIQISYKDLTFAEELRFDLLVERCLLVELKCVRDLHNIHKAQVLSDMKLLDVPQGLLINFFNDRVVDGVSRMASVTRTDECEADDGGSSWCGHLLSHVHVDPRFSSCSRRSATFEETELTNEMSASWIVANRRWSAGGRRRRTCRLTARKNRGRHRPPSTSSLQKSRSAPSAAPTARRNPSPRGPHSTGGFPVRRPPSRCSRPALRQTCR